MFHIYSQTAQLSDSGCQPSWNSRAQPFPSNDSSKVFFRDVYNSSTDLMTGMRYILSVARTRQVYIHCRWTPPGGFPRHCCVCVHAELNRYPTRTSHLAQMPNCVVRQKYMWPATDNASHCRVMHGHLVRAIGVHELCLLSSLTMMAFYSYILPMITRSHNDNHNNKFIER